jgi:limonene-1,2-epoxide hydrolase
MTDGASTTSNDAMIRAFLAAWERRDTEFIVDHFADDGVYHSIPLAPIVGKRAIREFVAGFVDVPPGRLVVHHQIASGDVVMNERTDSVVASAQVDTWWVCQSRVTACGRGRGRGCGSP